ncbi:DUF11 domain-containing protein [Methanobacterium alkalithermotolerans]|uniref:DUF11 domain-containing protein n=1 Tax=Methanobacterium alkalithermotolerans TaxID=2731220 RepID=A0A8T8K8G1_9EURY|nr:DUF11 domain-containing protein [Methanobacterium alkalithermotolerans]QUH23403.1 DUF11 domain-containing protein [Methanobacterium alkalithermotolerans]
MKKDMHKRLAIITATLFLVLVLAGSVSAASDIGVEKMVNDTTPNVGDSVDFAITATNYGPDAASQVVIQDYMSKESNGFEYVSHTATQGTYDPSNGLWIIDNFANGATATLNIQALVMDSGNVTNIAAKLLPLPSPLGDDPNPANDVDSVTMEVPPAADVGVEKWVDNDRPNIGDILRFYIEVFNNGPDNAANITVVDLLPIDVGINPGENLFVYQDWIRLPDDFTSASLIFDDVTNTWTIFFANINPGDYGLVYLDILLNNTGDAGNFFTNTATKTASSPYDWNTTNDQSSVDFYIPRADWTLTKTVDDVTPNVGDLITWIVTYTNTGPDNATGIIINDVIPAGLNVQSLVLSTGTYDAMTGDWSIPFLTSGANATLTVVTEVTSAIAGTVTTNVATKTAQNEYGEGPDFAAQAIYVPVADVAITKTVNNTTPNYWDSVIWTVTVTNNGPDTAEDVVVLDVPSSGLVILDAVVSQGSLFGTTWFVGNLANGATATLNITTLINATGVLNNTVYVGAETYDNDTTNNQDTTSVNVPPAADIAVVKTADNYTPNYWDIVTFTIEVTNNGPDAAPGGPDALRIRDFLPAGMTFVDAWASVPLVWDLNVAGDVVRFRNFADDLLPGETVYLYVQARVTQSNTTMNNTASRIPNTNDVYDPDPSNDSSTITLTVPPAADVAVFKSVTGAKEVSRNYNDVLWFWIDIINYGPDTANNVVLTDFFPAGLEYVSHGVAQGTFDPLTGIWNVGTVPSGAYIIGDFYYRIVTSNTTIINFAEVIADEYDWNMTNNISNATINVPPAVDIEVNKTVDNPTPNYLDTVLWTVSVTNNGPDVANNIVIGDIPDAGLTITNLVVTKGVFGVNWVIDTLSVGETAYMYITTLITASNTTLNNTAYLISVDEYEWDETNDSSTASVDVAAAADLLVSKTASTTTPSIGQIVQFVITVVNAGPDNATNVVVNDLLPAGLTFFAGSTTKGTYNVVDGIWTIGDLNVLEAAQLIIFAVVEPAMGTNVTNTADISGDEYDPFLENNHSSVTLQLPVSDLSVTKTADNTSVNVGDTVIWTVTLTNNGPANATNIELTDVPPAGFAINSVTPSVGTFDGMTGVWSIPSLLVGQIATLVIDTTAQASAAGTNQTNTITVTALDQYDPSPASDSATVYVKAADVAVTKTVNNATPNYLQNVTWTVTATNNGPDTATGVQITDIPPAGLNVLSVTPSQGTFDAMTGVWNVGTLANGASATLTIITQVTMANTTITNTATKTAENEYDPNPANDSDSATITVPPSADIGVTKTVNMNNPLVCENFTWTVTVTNNGPNDATGVQVTDIPPALLNVVSVTPSQGTFVGGVWSVGTLLNGESATLTIVTNATAAASGQTITNTATKTAADQYDWNPANNSDSESVSVPANKTFTLNVRNNGSARIHGIYYVTVYRPCGAPAIFNKYEFYLNPGQSISYNVGTFAVGTRISTDQFIYNTATTARTVSVTNTWGSTGVPSYVQNYVVANVPGNQARAALARYRFTMNRNNIGVEVVRLPAIL